MILDVSFSLRLFVGDIPAGISSTTANFMGFSWLALEMSLARTANPSMLELVKSGKSILDLIPSYNTLPAASDNGIVSLSKG